MGVSFGGDPTYTHVFVARCRAGQFFGHPRAKTINYKAPGTIRRVEYAISAHDSATFILYTRIPCPACMRCMCTVHRSSVCIDDENTKLRKTHKAFCLYFVFVFFFLCILKWKCKMCCACRGSVCLSEVTATTLTRCIALFSVIFVFISRAGRSSNSNGNINECQNTKICLMNGHFQRTNRPTVEAISVLKRY